MKFPATSRWLFATPETSITTASSPSPRDFFPARTCLFLIRSLAIAAGSFGQSLSFWVDDDISTGGSGADGGLGDGYLRANDLGHYFHLPKDSLNVRFGQFELDLPFTQARTINLTDYDIYDQASYRRNLGNDGKPSRVCRATAGH